MMFNNGPLSPQALTSSLLNGQQQAGDPTSRLAYAMMPMNGGIAGPAAGVPQGNGQLPTFGLTGAIAPGKFS